MSIGWSDPQDCHFVLHWVSSDVWFVHFEFGSKQQETLEREQCNNPRDECIKSCKFNGGRNRMKLMRNYRFRSELELIWIRLFSRYSPFICSFGSAGLGNYSLSNSIVSSAVIPLQNVINPFITFPRGRTKGQRPFLISWLSSFDDTFTELHLRNSLNERW